MARVYCGLAADRRVDLSQQCRRNLHVIDATPHHRRGETGEIADHAATERNDDVIALNLCSNERIADALEIAKALAALAGWHFDGRNVDAGLRERSLRSRKVMPRHCVIGDDCDLASWP